jgi:hypothetical protein
MAKRITFNEWKRYCAEAHVRANKRYGKHPYSYHLDLVDEALLRFGFTSRSYRFAGQGHDLLEDTAETRETILRAGASLLAYRGMWGVTDEEGATREEKKHRTYPKIRRSHIASVIKLADRIANVEENVRTANVEGFLKYKREHVELERRVRDSKKRDAEPMWEHLTWLFRNGRKLMRQFKSGGKPARVPA